MEGALTPLIRATPRPLDTSVTSTSSPIVVMSHCPSRVSATGPPVYSGRMEFGDARKLLSAEVRRVRAHLVLSVRFGPYMVDGEVLMATRLLMVADG
jgi:hypothetical protein